MRTSIFRRIPAKDTLWRYVWAYALVPASSVFALGVTLLLKPYLEYTPLVFLYVAVFLCTRLGGAGPGVLATVITLLLAEQYVLPAPWRFDRGWGDVGSVLAYVVVSLATVAVVGTLRSRTGVLRQKEAQLTDFMEHATLGLHWLAEDGTVIWANTAACELLGYPAHRYVGRNIHELHEDPKEASDILRRLG